MNDWEIMKRHMDYLLSSGVDWNSLYKSKVSRIKWLAYYAKNLPKEEHDEFISTIEEIKTANEMLAYLMSVKPQMVMKRMKGEQP